MALFINWHLLSDEKPIHECRVSWKVYALYYLGGIAFLILAGVLPFIVGVDSPIKPGISAIVFAVLGLLLIVSARLKSRKELVLLTTERLLIRKKVGTGFFKGTTMEAIALNKIDDIQVQQTFVQKLLGDGDIRFRVSGQEHLIEDIDKPNELERAIYRILEKEKSADHSSSSEPDKSA